MRQRGDAVTGPEFLQLQQDAEAASEVRQKARRWHRDVTAAHVDAENSRVASRSSPLSASPALRRQFGLRPASAHVDTSVS